MFKEELKKQLVKNRLAPLLVIVLAVDALYSLFSSVKPEIFTNLEGSLFQDLRPYYSAWSMFLNNSSLNWVLLIFISVTALKIWADEYRLNMQMYNLTSVKGRGSLAGKKVLVTLGLVLPAALISEFIRILMFGINLSFENLPLNECGSFFEASEFPLTALQAVLISVMLHFLGYLLFCGLCIFTAVLIRNSVSCLGLDLAIMLVPIYIFDDGDVRLRFPFPVSFLQGEKMFCGSIIDAISENSDDPIYLYKALSTSNIVINVIFAVFLSAVLILLSAMIFSGVKPRFKKAKAIALSTALLMLLSGCNGNVLPKNETSKYISMNDHEHVYSKKSGEIFAINPTPLTNWHLEQVYGKYAIVTENMTPGIYNGKFYIKAVNLEDFSETLLYARGMEADPEGMLGLEDVIDLPDWLLYDPDVVRYSSNFIYAGDKLYFGGNNDILCIDLSSNTETRLFENVNYSDVVIRDEGVYYKNKDDGMIYLNNMENKVTPFPADYYAVGKDAVAAVSSEDGCLYLITEKGTEKLFDDKIQGILYTSKAVTVFDVYSENAGMVVTFALTGGSLKDYGKCAYYADEDGVYFFEDGKVTVQEY